MDNRDFDGAEDNREVVTESSQFDESEIFNDVLEGGGVEPSIDDTIRDSIKYSFVSSEDEKTVEENNGQSRDAWVMSRMSWIQYLKVLFDELESYSQANLPPQVARQKHVEVGNFVKALRRIKNLLPLQQKLDYLKACGEVSFSYKEVEQGL